MRKRLLFCLLLFVSANLFSQYNLSGSRQNSFYTYIYGISSSETMELYKSDMDKAGEKYLHTLIDSFPSDKDEPKALKEGNYLFVYAQDNRLNYDLKTVADVEFKLLNNNHDLIIALHTKQGQLISDADVFINNRKIAFDTQTKTYRLNKTKRTGLIKVKYHDVLHLFPLANNNRGNYRKLSFLSKLSNSFPLKYVRRSLRKLGNHQNYTSSYFNGTQYEKKFTGFMVFSKPRYKPGDTVKLKAFIIYKNGTPVNRSLRLRLSERDFEKDTILTTLKPYRPGGYEYQFVITDSLDLSLDDDQFIMLEELKSSKNDFKKYDGDLDRDIYSAKRKVLMRGKFEYEDYQLGTVHFTARADKEMNQRNNPLAIYLKATDENDMAIMDGRVQLIVTPDVYGSNNYFGEKVFLPDTLWNHIQPLEALGETKIIIPDSIFPAASFDYQVQCMFLNEDNEYKTVTLSESFQNNKHKIFFTESKDSLKIEQKTGQDGEMAAGFLYCFGEKNDTLQTQTLQLPATIHINPFVKYYVIETDSAEATFQLKHSRDMVSCLAARTKDSINIQGINPKHISFWYTIFAGNKVIHRGFGDSLSYMEKTHTAKNYFVSLQYVYGNEVYNEEYTVPYQDKLLNVQVNQPEFIYPGQKIAVDISVTNKAGKPVNNADITAYSFTDKFEDGRAPFVPYMGKIYPRTKGYMNFYKAALDNKIGSSNLNWQRWSREMGLDSIEYFKFLHPENIYTNTETATDSVTQLAPFVVIKGDLQPIHQIYIDEVPYYFSQAEQLQRYSFKVDPGKHALRLRTNNLVVSLDSVWAYKGVKTFISVNADSFNNKQIGTKKMPDTLTAYEKVLWSKYMILMENDFGEAPATITQPDFLYLLNLRGNSLNRQGQILTGPLFNQYTTLTVKNKFSQPFEAEGNYLFNISPGLIKQKQLPFGNYAFNTRLSGAKPVNNFHDLVLTQNEIDSMWQDYLDHRNATEDLFRNENLTKYNCGRLELSIDKDVNDKPVFIKNIFLFRYDDADFVRVYKGNSVNLGYLQPGMYRIFFLLKGDGYYIKEGVQIRKDGINFYQTGVIVPQKKDTVSIQIAAIINGREKTWRSALQDNDLGAIKESFNNKYINPSNFSRYIFGVVRGIKDGLPIFGATILIKGTRFGTQTNTDGSFRLGVPDKGTIAITAVGFERVEKRITDEANYEIKLRETTSALNEVVVVGYSAMKKVSLTGSVSSISSDNILMGKAAGVQINIRGLASRVEGNNPLIIVDGVPFWGKLDTTKIAGIKVMEASNAKAIYGSRASGGVIIITTKKGNINNGVVAEENTASQANALRHNFRDDAYWQPKLKTDLNGKVSFTVTFPDDITKWRTFVIAMVDKRQTGFEEGSVKSFKAISASMSLPSFAIEGDSINAIGKMLNYTMDSIRLTRSFSVNDTLVKELVVDLRNSIIDTLAVTATTHDSLKIKYTIQKQDGYFDGEEKSIRVYKQGVEETKGYFAALDNDTSFSLSFDASAGKVKLYAESSLLPVLLDEIENIHRYEYLCNEQLASKLKALLLKKKIYSYLQKKFEEEKNIESIITKLNQGKSQAGLWGWWTNNDPLLWISLHATEALLMAEKAGYKIDVNKEIIKDYLIYNFGKYNVADMTPAVLLLKALNAKVEFKNYVDTLQKKTALMNQYQRLQFLQLKQQLSIPVALDTLLAKSKATMFGNMYWGEDNRNFFDNSVQNTLLMYRLMRTAGGYEKQLQKVRNYFLEKRRGGQWSNTYESSLILETILPDLMNDNAAKGQSSLAINDSPAVKIFTYSTEINSTEKLVINKQGKWPVYFTAYQQYWNTAPEKKEGDFTVNSFFEKNDQKIATLKAGEPIIMKVNVSVRADADFVMVEIPVPAGCSYKDKQQQWNNNEVHREYFKNKVSIFCSSLRKGDYTFTVSLLPRYTGSYHLNPANAEMMYFPVFYGREGMKKIVIN